MSDFDVTLTAGDVAGTGDVMAVLDYDERHDQWALTAISDLRVPLTDAGAMMAAAQIHSPTDVEWNEIAWDVVPR